MKIKHNSIFEAEKIAETYTKRDGVPVKYVCTSDVKTSDMPMDIFYRDTPHPEFGNKYFGIYTHPMSGEVYITEADMIDGQEFGMVENDSGELEYSESHHMYKSFKNGNMIDGGRQYVRGSGDIKVFRVVNGEFISD